MHAPLTFDLVDTWNDRSLGGCRYDVLRVNAYEAENRRLSRFTQLAHTAGRLTVGPPTINPAHPFTLDLRR